jgi:hypothetical protein
VKTAGLDNEMISNTNWRRPTLGAPPQPGDDCEATPRFNWTDFRQRKLIQFQHEIAELKALPELTAVQQCELRLLEKLEHLLQH